MTSGDRQPLAQLSNVIFHFSYFLFCFSFFVFHFLIFLFSFIFSFCPFRLSTNCLHPASLSHLADSPTRLNSPDGSLWCLMMMSPNCITIRKHTNQSQLRPIVHTLLPMNEAVRKAGETGKQVFFPATIGSDWLFEAPRRIGLERGGGWSRAGLGSGGGG